MNISEIAKKVTGGNCDTCSKSKTVKNGLVSFSKSGIKYQCDYKYSIDEFNNPCKYYNIKHSFKVNAALRRIRAQFPQTSEGKLMCSIIEQAVNDLRQGPDKQSAINFLSGSMPQAEICGIESKWITGTLISCGLLNIDKYQ